MLSSSSCCKILMCSQGRRIAPPQRAQLKRRIRELEVQQESSSSTPVQREQTEKLQQQLQQAASQRDQLERDYVAAETEIVELRRDARRERRQV